MKHFFNLTLFTLVYRVLIKRLFLSCIEYTCNSGPGYHSQKMFEKYTSYSNYNSPFVGETLIWKIEYN